MVSSCHSDIINSSFSIFPTEPRLLFLLLCVVLDLFIDRKKGVAIIASQCRSIVVAVDA